MAEAPEAHYREVVRIADLAGHDGIVAGHVFTECQILGPAVLAALEGTVNFEEVSFDVQSVDAMLWEVPPAKTLVGATGLRHVTFTRCRFSLVGIVGPAAELDRWRRALGGG